MWKPNYVAPEVINNKGYVGAKADLWSCGVILFVLMAGYLPFEDSNMMSLYKKIFKAEFTCSPWFSASAKKLIKRILDPNPATVYFLTVLYLRISPLYLAVLVNNQGIMIDDINSNIDNSNGR